ncbi:MULTISPECIES: ribosome biogenesis GTP-binding protein YihA/YsxC [Apibacter]|uniref:ribosome biogenesis GTP-binding protein YihA/YsxC n=1 Tax=Apibacter TaxID=1778601 RepID=UPI000CF8B4C7|nr:MULTISPECIES: ribosome biogenesis GTP-binding protein YihA/YsxC [Apibacter]MCX8677255.1 YihA family ribosome biogenesis GTP-binding protein [Apibacter sp. B3919]MXO23679.1 YihA family ribosome biogenesis GTP-binding protein [Apibacter sp. B3924]MXO26728.1 YihA family ribosome biogenesis GTP-binding protein [Apibacter sp. B3813]MXO28702.1 YihA family ribosome biogenesis GTP-binding protein [Apibacter sp. B3913]MXO30656.1 YihA family ribosome biogenesis GTP-binding protein [Apibacter sp. B391
MNIYSAEFIKSSKLIEDCPEGNKPEYAFIGRSNVGKSSLINMLTNKKGLAKTSSTPGKTQLINHFLINDNWYLTDLPGYGYAKASKTNRAAFSKMIEKYVLSRKNLVNLFVLIDARHLPLKIDIDFINWLGESGIPFSLIFTKLDKVTQKEFSFNFKKYSQELRKTWDDLPEMFKSSSEKKIGKEEILSFIEDTNKYLARNKIYFGD